MTFRACAAGRTSTTPSPILQVSDCLARGSRLSALREALEAMSSNPGGGAERSCGGPFGRWIPLALVLAGLIAPPGRVAAEDVTPFVSPDRIDDVPSTKPDPFPAFDNFAWRAFVALNWPALADASHRGLPDRAKTLGDLGPRVWETFKSRYELFQAGPDGRPVAPHPWASYEALNPCGPDADNRAKTFA